MFVYIVCNLPRAEPQSCCTLFNFIFVSLYRYRSIWNVLISVSADMLFSISKQLYSDQCSAQMSSNKDFIFGVLTYCANRTLKAGRLLNKYVLQALLPSSFLQVFLYIHLKNCSLILPTAENILRKRDCKRVSLNYRMGRRISAIWLVNYCVRIFHWLARDIAIAIAIAKTISTILRLFTPARKCEPSFRLYI